MPKTKKQTSKKKTKPGAMDDNALKRARERNRKARRQMNQAQRVKKGQGRGR